jgi:hypothetical protein
MGASNVGDDAESALMGKYCFWSPLPGLAVANRAAMRLGPLGFHPLHLRPSACALRLPLKDTKGCQVWMLP